MLAVGHALAFAQMNRPEGTVVLNIFLKCIHFFRIHVF